MTHQYIVPAEEWTELNRVLRDPLFRHTPITRKIMQLISEGVVTYE